MSSHIVSSHETSLKDEQSCSFVNLERRIGQLEHAARELKSELWHLRESSQSTSPDTGAPFSDVIAVTEEMFGTPEVSVMSDPEDAGIKFVLFTVRAMGENSVLIDKRIEWHERIRAISPGCSSRFRLSIVPLK